MNHDEEENEKKHFLKCPRRVLINELATTWCDEKKNSIQRPPSQLIWFAQIKENCAGPVSTRDALDFNNTWRLQKIFCIELYTFQQP